MKDRIRQNVCATVIFIAYLVIIQISCSVLLAGQFYVEGGDIDGDIDGNLLVDGADLIIMMGVWLQKCSLTPGG